MQFPKSIWRAPAVLAIVATACILLYLSLRGIDWHIVTTTIRAISPGYAAIAIVVGSVPIFLRAVRWRILLQASGPVSFRTTFWAVATGYFGNNFLPARGGEVVRSYVVRNRSDLAIGYILATALSERVADAVALVLIGAVALMLTPRAAAWTGLVRGSFAVIGVVGLLGLCLLPHFQVPADKILRTWPRLQNVMRQILAGIRSFHDFDRLAQFTALTVAIWALDAIATSTLAHSLKIEMPVAVAMILIVGLSLSSALPSAPGYVGVYQFVAVMVLKPFGILPSAAIAFILVMQAINYLVTGLLGLLAVTRFTPFDWQAFRNPLQASQIQS